jgi:alpha-glucosidase
MGKIAGNGVHKIDPWFPQLGNHDNGRVGSRFRPELIDGFNMVSLMLPGIAVTYYVS